MKMIPEKILKDLRFGDLFGDMSLWMLVDGVDVRILRTLWTQSRVSEFVCAKR
jgi:hypothetical protein